MWKPYHWHNLPKFAWNLTLRGGPNVNSSRPQNIIHNLPHRNPCRRFIHDNFLWTLKPSPPSAEANVDGSPPSRPTRDLQRPRSRALVHTCAFVKLGGPMNDVGGKVFCCFLRLYLYLFVFGFSLLSWAGRWAPCPVLLDKTCMFQNRHHGPNRKWSKEERGIKLWLLISSSHRDS